MEPRPSYGELAGKLAELGEVFRALRSQEVDAVVGTKSIFMLRLKETEDEIRRQRGALEDLLAERSRLLEDSKLSRDRYLDLYDFAPVGYLTLDAAGAVLEANLTAAKLMGLEKNGLIGARFAEFIEPEFRPGFFSCIGETLKTDAEQRCEMKVHKSDGVIFYALLQATAARDADGNLDRLRAILADISIRKRAEAQLVRKSRELEAANAELQQFAYVASHDLREPLRMVASFTQVLEKRYKGALDATADEYIAFIVDGVARMQSLIDDILAYSRVGTRGVPFEAVPMDDVLRNVLVNLKPSIEETGATVTHDPLPVIQADPVQMMQVLQNLIGNAIKFHREGVPPVVHVAAGPAAGELEFSVRDNGIGIAPELFGRLFTLFQRLNPRDKYPGSGLGLAITKKIVGRHGGRIWVESQPGEGATFHFSVSAKPESEEDGAA
jgi:PAS domain S-box-containing protein